MQAERGLAHGTAGHFGAHEPSSYAKPQKGDGVRLLCRPHAGTAPSASCSSGVPCNGGGGGDTPYDMEPDMPSDSTPSVMSSATSPTSSGMTA